MKILLFTTTYFNLHGAIVDELRAQGHEVCVVEDKFLRGDPKLKRSLYQRCRYHEDFRTWNNRVKEFWACRADDIDKDYDLFICLNGVSIDEEVIADIRRRNPQLKDLILYAWDDLSYWNYNLIKSSFTKTLTFDLLDSRRYKDWKLLPPFYVGSDNSGQEEIYNLFMVGSNHDRRYIFIDKILKQLKALDIKKNYIKLLRANIGPRFRLIKSALRHLSPSYRLNYDFNSGLFPEYVLDNPISIAEYNDIMSASKYVLDDVRPGQSGLPPRFVWALANNKKIITTNQYASQYTFVNQETVMYIDRDDPRFDKEFFVDTQAPVNNNLPTLEISYWVRILIGEEPIPVYDRLANG